MSHTGSRNVFTHVHPFWKNVACGLCGKSVEVHELPDSTMAECFECMLADRVKRGLWPPKLPWWKVAP